MTTTLITCAYSITAVGAVAVADLATRFAAVPVDLTTPDAVGLLYVSDATATVGQVVTRTIAFRAIPTVVATATAALFPGQAGGPIDTLTLGASGAEYAAPPIIALTSGSPFRPGKAIATMGVGSVLVIAGGGGYTAPVATFVGGDLPPEGVQATATVTLFGGAVTGIVVVTPGGPYQVPPALLIADPTVSNPAILSPTLKVTGVELLDPGEGYVTAPTPTFTPLFPSICPDAQPASQKAFLANWMTVTFQRALKMPVIAAAPVIT